jgi:transcriptional regulator with XRE-family HTH domain
VNRLAYGLRRTRLEHGLNMSEMASVLGVHVATVSRIESGERLAIRWVPEAIAAKIGIPVTDLLSEHARTATTRRRMASCVAGAGAPDKNQQRGRHDHDQQI